MPNPLPKWTRRFGPLERWHVEESERVVNQLQQLYPDNPRKAHEYIDAIRLTLQCDPYVGKPVGLPLGRDIRAIVNKSIHGNEYVRILAYYTFDDTHVFLQDIKIDAEPYDPQRHGTF